MTRVVIFLFNLTYNQIIYLSNLPSKIYKWHSNLGSKIKTYMSNSKKEFVNQLGPLKKPWMVIVKVIFPCNDIHWHKVFLHTKYLLYSIRSFNINMTLANYCMNYFLVVLTLEDITSLWIPWIMFLFPLTCLVAPK